MKGMCGGQYIFGIMLAARRAEEARKKEGEWRGGADSQMARKFGVSRATKDEEEKGKFVSVSLHRIQHSPEKKKNRPKDSRKSMI